MPAGGAAAAGAGVADDFLDGRKPEAVDGFSYGGSGHAQASANDLVFASGGSGGSTGLHEWKDPQAVFMTLRLSLNTFKNTPPYRPVKTASFVFFRRANATALRLAGRSRPNTLHTAFSAGSRRTPFLFDGPLLGAVLGQ